ncbi:hypothetical protein EV189_1072 [Motilibacter rhizosphaerae]|uniref:MarR family transcriptional regulator n=1 Tax=Motilibacter rhizosphaerae TaxID=598652 RepID=A0A4Q7NXU0_9ACTN|nr:hypothetical protein [Motilibacter rhizosphaerae]RZS91820.1 hypothetical protein EV189_1072 [Motilibacter rhizosphaerae]
MPLPRPLPTVVGPTENALRALLDRTLSSTRIPGYHAWVVLNAVSAAGPGEDWRRTALEGGGPEEIHAALGRLRTAGLVGEDETPTALGTAELTAARTSVAAVTAQLTAGIDEAEQETTRRVLDEIRRGAEVLLQA